MTLEQLRKETVSACLAQAFMSEYDRSMTLMSAGAFASPCVPAPGTARPPFRLAPQREAQAPRPARAEENLTLGIESNLRPKGTTAR